MAKILTAFDKSDSKKGDSGVAVETWAKLGHKTWTQKLAPKFDPCNFYPCISTPLPIRVKHHASLVYFVTNDPIRDMRVSSIKEAISHLGGVPHAGALKPAFVSQLVALNADGLSSVTDSPENTLGGGPEAALPPNFVTPASSALTIISDHVDASTVK